MESAQDIEPGSIQVGRWRLRHPFSGISHLVGAILGCVALTVLLVLSRGSYLKITSFVIYGVSLVALYLASTLYHLVSGRPEVIERLRRFDQIGIYLLIAGTYTPICLLAIRGPWGIGMLIAVWAIAVGGVLTQILWPAKPVSLNVTLYVIMGWMALIGVGPMIRGLGPDGFAWLVGGGIIYTVGAVIFAIERPRLWPGVFGFHDLWHLFVLAGSGAHFVVMLQLLARPV